MTDKDDGPRAISHSTTSTTAPTASAGTISTNNPLPPSSTSENGTPAAARPPNAQRSLNVSNAPSITASPLSSRDTSPARPSLRQPVMSTGTGLPKRSRQHSTDVSPNRPPSLQNASAIPSAAAVQRALSATNTPQLKPTPAEEPGKNDRPQKTSDPSSGETTPRWPISPRLKSPPPSATRSRKNSLTSLRSQARTQSPSQTPAKKPESTIAPPSITVQSSTPPSTAGTTRSSAKNDTVQSDSEEQSSLTMKSAPRGVSGASRTLETVQEGSLPNTPGFELAQAQSLQSISEHSATSSDAASESSSKTITDSTHGGTTGASTTESGSDSGENRTDDMSNSISGKNATPRAAVPSKSSYSSLAPAKSRTVNEAKTMIVETETVPSVPLPTIGTQGERVTQGRSDPSGTVRLKPSSETIRPKKAKKPVRKAPSITSGTASSKADIFEAQVASAVDEANSSDSDETFVYESNPPDSQRNGFHHSRTPSVTSMNSIENPRHAARSSIANVLDNHRQVPTKRSMKFASNSYSTHNGDFDGSERSDGTVRIGGGRGGGNSVHHHHHIVRHGRGPPSILDTDSPFPPNAKGRASRQSSRPNSPRQKHATRFGNGPTKQNSELSMYDMAGEAADDERTPLIRNVRGQRDSRNARPPRAVAVQHYEHFQRQQDSWLRRFAGCIVLTVIMILLLAAAVGFLFSTTKPLYDVEIEKIRNVLASEQELMLDLVVSAVNPNVVSVTVYDLDVNVFAKSKHVGSEKWWREHQGHRKDNLDDILGPSSAQTRRRRADTDGTVQISKGKDEGNDPIEDPEGGSTTMLLGRIVHFDSALVFEGSPWKREAHSSLGEIRVHAPGNKTELGGTERWERVILYPFELIVRGVIRYQLPLSSHTHSAAISMSTVVHPEKGIDSDGRMHTESLKEHIAHGGGDLFDVINWTDHENHDFTNSFTELELAIASSTPASKLRAES